MPRYFFHVRDGEDFPDREGTELSGPEEARREAVQTAGRMLAEGNQKFWGGDPWTMAVVDDAGEIICEMNFSAVAKTV